MSLDEQQRQKLVELYLSKSDELMVDAQVCITQKRWNAAANRLYYALFNAIAALFVHDHFIVGTHNGVKILFGKEYVLTGLATSEEGKLLSQMESMRERADYDVTFIATEETINERAVPVANMINHLKELINREE